MYYVSQAFYITQYHFYGGVEMLKEVAENIKVNVNFVWTTAVYKYICISQSVRNRLGHAIVAIGKRLILW